MFRGDFLEHVPKTITDPFKTTTALHDKIDALPQIREWLSVQHAPPQKLKLTYFDIRGRGEPTRLAKRATSFAAGDKLTVAELAIVGVIGFLRHGELSHVSPEVVEQFPQLLAIYDRVMEHPKVQEYYAMHEEPQTQEQYA
ncbi:hypothetical protein PINS_up016933 [Pythium insidiosum]|nr:hypothetical protein PINS_up016933 [Pythium insidiosum]